MAMHEFEIPDFEERYSKLRFQHQQTQFESIKLQCVFLETLRKHHLLWAKSSADQESASIHIDIANLIKQTSDPYKRLLERFL